MEQGGNVMFAAKADAYLNRDSFHLTVNEDTYLYTAVTRRDKQKEESSSGAHITTSGRDGSHGGGGKF